MQMRVVGYAINFMREPKGEFLVQAKIIGVVAQSLVSDQVNARVHPSPTLIGRVGEHRNVVGHVVPMEAPDFREAWLQLGDQIRVGHCLVKKALLFLRLQFNP